MEYVPGGSLRQLLNEKGVIRVYMLEFIVHMRKCTSLDYAPIRE